MVIFYTKNASTLPVTLVDFNFEVSRNFYIAYRTCIVVLKPTLSTWHTTHMLAWQLDWILQKTFTNLALTRVKPAKTCAFTQELVLMLSI